MDDKTNKYVSLLLILALTYQLKNEIIKNGTLKWIPIHISMANAQNTHNLMSFFWLCIRRYGSILYMEIPWLNMNNIEKSVSLVVFLPFFLYSKDFRFFISCRCGTANVVLVKQLNY